MGEGSGKEVGRTLNARGRSVVHLLITTERDGYYEEAEVIHRPILTCDPARAQPASFLEGPNRWIFLARPPNLEATTYF